MGVRTTRQPDGSVRSWAPGRATLMGDHTDYNFGLSLASPLRRGTWAEVRPSRRIDEFRSVDGRAPADWERYLTATMRAVRDLEPDCPPVQIDIWGDLPIGRGLSSSASLISAVLAAALGAVLRDVTPENLALLAQRVENVHLQIPTGTLDQEVIVKHPGAEPLLIDFASGLTTPLPMPVLDGHRLVVVDPGLPRQLDGANFGRRRDECAEALTRVFGRSDQSAWSDFRTSPWSDVEAAALPTLLHDRLRHVWTENHRVTATVAALKDGDASRLAMLLNASHESLRDQFEVSIPAIESARDALLACTGVRAVRMVGAGFGGCFLALIEGDVATLPLPFFDALEGP